MGTLSKLKITLGKQSASALCTKTRQAEQRERSQSTKTPWLSNARPHFAQKRTKRSNGSARKGQKHAGRAMRTRTLHKNAPSGATGALPKHKNTLAEQCASALCTKTHQAKQREHSQSTKTHWQSNARPHFAQKRTKRSNGSAPKAQKHAGEAMRPALCTKSHQRHTVRDMGVGMSV